MRKICTTIFSVVGLYLLYLFIASAVNMDIQDALQPKVQQALSSGLQEIIENGNRVEYTDGQYTYYVPDIHNLGLYWWDAHY